MYLVVTESGDSYQTKDLLMEDIQDLTDHNDYVYQFKDGEFMEFNGEVFIKVREKYPS